MLCKTKQNITFRYDAALTIKKDFFKFLIIIAITLFFCFDFSARHQSLFNADGVNLVLSDYLFGFFAGINRFRLNEGVFELPIFWFLVQMFILYSLVKYPKEDLYGSGIYVLLKSKSRKKWWFSKCVWCVYSVALFYALIVGVILIFCIANGEPLTFELRRLGESNLFLYTEEEMGYRVILSLCLPLLCSIALALFQLTISFIATPVIAFITSAVILISSAYHMSPFLIGSISMLRRSEIFMQEGLKLLTSNITCAAVSIVSAFAGYFVFAKSDILGKD
jgi:hypothetical protein